VWLVDLQNETVQAYSQPTLQGYSEIRQFWRGQTVTLETLPNVSIPVNDILG